MIYDCFTFFNELDILEIRLEELYPVVDRFLVVEGSLTFQGTPKPAIGWNTPDRFDKYSDKISWCYLNHGWPDGSSWEREYFQRNKIKDFLNYDEMNDDDIIILSDADEIPRREDLKTAIDKAPDLGVVSLGLDAYYYGLNVSGGHQHTNRVATWEYAKQRNMQELRMDGPHNTIEHAGWHFSYLGDAEHIVEKFKAFAHTELNRYDTTNPDVLRERMNRLGDLWGDGHIYERVEIDDTWPELIKNDRERWRKFEW